MYKKSKPDYGKVWYTVAAQGSVGQPPYIIKENGRWWLTKTCMGCPYRQKFGGDCTIDDLPHLSMGVRRVMDYLIRNYPKKIRDIPFWKHCKANRNNDKVSL